MEIDHAIPVDVHLRMQGADKTWGHWLGSGIPHALDCLILCNLILTLVGCPIPLLDPNIQLIVIATIDTLILRQVVDSKLRSVAHDDAHVVAELFVGDQVVAISIHLIKSLHYVDRFNPRRDQCTADLMTLEAAHLGALLLKYLPQRLLTVIVEHMFLFDWRLKLTFWLGLGRFFSIHGCSPLRCSCAASSHNYFTFYDKLYKF